MRKLDVINRGLGGYNSRWGLTVLKQVQVAICISAEMILNVGCSISVLREDGRSTSLSQSEAIRDLVGCVFIPKRHQVIEINS
jgi:hypothetical protein